MQLVEYVNSLFEQGLSGEEVIAKTQEWKKKNQPKKEAEGKRASSCNNPFISKIMQ